MNLLALWAHPEKYFNNSVIWTEKSGKEVRGRRRRRGGGKSGGSNFYHRAAFPQVHFAVPLDNGAHIRIRGGAVRAAKREEKNVKGKKKSSSLQLLQPS